MFLLLTTAQKGILHDLAKKFSVAGLPYIFGAERNPADPPDEIVARRSPFDCSELVEYLFRQIGIVVPDGARYQFAASQPVPDGETPEVGDLCFKKKHGEINHVSMVMSIEPTVLVEADGYTGKVKMTALETFSHPKPTASQYAGMRRFMLDKVEQV